MTDTPDQKSENNQPPVQAWKCPKCQDSNMLIVDTPEGIMVLCATQGCVTGFPELSVKVIDPSKDPPKSKK